MAFTPKRRIAQHRPKVKAFPKDNKKKPVHLTCFPAYKAGMTHILRISDKPGSSEWTEFCDRLFFNPLSLLFSNWIHEINFS